jgi:hypothetical protein
MTGHPKAKRKPTTFERRAGAMPTLQRAVPRPAGPDEAAAVDAPDETSEAAVPGFLTHKEVILRLVETLKAL